MTGDRLSLCLLRCFLSYELMLCVFVISSVIMTSSSKSGYFVHKCIYLYVPSMYRNEIRLAAQAARLGGFGTFFWPGGNTGTSSTSATRTLSLQSTWPDRNLKGLNTAGPLAPYFSGRSAQLTWTRTAWHSLAPSKSYGVISCY